MKKEIQMTMLVNCDGVTIEFDDPDAVIQFMSIELTAEQYMAMMGRRSHVWIEAEFRGLDKIGKVRESEPLSFQVPDDAGYHERKEIARDLAVKLCEGTEWVPSLHFGSQSSFTRKDGVTTARTTKHRWVDPAESTDKEKEA
jgi:hypothetical protein